MKKLLGTVFFATVLLVIVTGCDTMKTATKDTSAADMAAILAADSAWSKTASAVDVEAFNSFLLDDAKMLAPETPTADGKEAFVAFTGAMFAMPGFTIKWVPNSATVANSGDLGYSLGTYDMTVNGPDGKPMSDSGKYITIWKKQADGSWKVAVDMFNSNMAM